MSPSLSVIVPVYNEARTIDAILRRVSGAGYCDDLIVIDDGSTDGTSEVLREWSARPGVRVIVHERNRGKGAAIRTGLAIAANVYVIIQDADLEYDPSDYVRLLEPLIAGNADVVYGSRRLGRGWQLREWANPFYLGVSALNVIVWMLYGRRLTDEATCYKVMETRLLRSMQLECERFEFCPEVTAKVCRMGLRIVEVPISYSRRSVAAGKKIRLRDWFEAVGVLWKWRTWSPRVNAFAISQLVKRSEQPTDEPVRLVR